MNQKDLLEQINRDTSLNGIQEYIKQVLEIRGFAGEPIQDMMMLLLEETGELAKAVRKSHTGMSVDVNKLYNYDTVESEIADVFFVLLSICNKLGVDIFEALIAKEKVNCERIWNVDSLPRN